MTSTTSTAGLLWTWGNKMDEIDALLKPGESQQKNWYQKLPPEVRQLLTQLRARKQSAENKTATYAVLHTRLRERFGNLIPKDRKRIGEFLRNEGNCYPDAEAADGAEQIG